MRSLRNFTRYFFPGLTFLVEFVLLFALAVPGEGQRVVNSIPLDLRGAATILGGALALAAIGYFISVVHHCLYWRFDWYAPGDPRIVIKRLQSNRHLVLSCAGRSVPEDGLSRPGAWRVFTAIWHGRRTWSQRIKGATARADSLSDLMHGAGAGLIGSIFAILVAIISALQTSTTFRPPWFLTLAVAMVIIHFYSFRTTGSHAHGFVDLVLYEELSQPPLVANKDVKTGTPPSSKQKASGEGQKAPVDEPPTKRTYYLEVFEQDLGKRDV